MSTTIINPTQSGIENLKIILIIWSVYKTHINPDQCLRASHKMVGQNPYCYKNTPENQFGGAETRAGLQNMVTIPS
jgi:hypothetical protein